MQRIEKELILKMEDNKSIDAENPENKKTESQEVIQNENAYAKS